MNTFKKAIYALIFCAVFVFVGGAAKQALADATITGKVTKADGVTVVPNMTVYAYKGNQMFWDGTDTNGNYSIDITGASITGTYVVKTNYAATVYDIGTTVSHPLYFYPQQNSTVAVVDGGATPGINFSLNQHGMASGKIIDSSGAPIYDMTTQLYNNSGIFYPYGYDFSDELGNYYITPYNYPSDYNLSTEGAYYLNFSSSRYLTKRVDNIQITNNQTTTQNVTLLRKSIVTGKVTKADGTTAIPGALIKVYKENSSSVSFSSTTASDGTYTIYIDGTDDTYSAIGDYVIEAWSTGTDNYVRQSSKISVTVEESTISNTNFALAEGGIVSGKITKADGTTAISRATVKIENNNYSQTVYTADDGTYALRGVEPASDYMMTITKTNYLQKKVSNVSATTGGTTEKNFSLAAKNSALSGKVRTKKGVAIPWAKVQATSITDSSITESVYSDSTGSYNLTDLTAGTYKVVVTKDGYETNEISKLKISGSDTKNFKMKKGAQVSGKINDKAGNPISGAFISFTSARKNNGYYSVYTNEEGYYRISTLAAAKYNVVVSAANFVKKTKTKKFKAGQIVQDYNLKLTKGGTISGYVFNTATSRPLASKYVQIVDTDLGGTTSSSGYYEITGVPKGSYKLFIRDIYYYLEQFYYKTTIAAQAKKVKVRSGKETKNINFYLTPYYKVY